MNTSTLSQCNLPIVSACTFTNFLLGFAGIDPRFRYITPCRALLLSYPLVEGSAHGDCRSGCCTHQTSNLVRSVPYRRTVVMFGGERTLEVLMVMISNKCSFQVCGIKLQEYCFSEHEYTSLAPWIMSLSVRLDRP